MSNSGLRLADLAAEARRLQASAWAVSTKKSLSSEQSCFLDFCSRFNIPDFPVDGETLVLFAAYLVSSGKLKSAASVKQYLSAVSVLHKMFGLSCHVPSSYGPLGHIVSGIERELAAPVKKMLPITPAILYNLLTGLNLPPTNPWSSQVFLATLKAAYLILFLSMLRCGNILPNSKSDADPIRHLSWGRVERHNDGVILNVVLSKTIQNSERVHQMLNFRNLFHLIQMI